MVSVSGSGFVSGATSVTVDGVSVVAAVASGSVLSFVSPADAAGVVDVVVVTSGRTSSPALGFTYVAVPTAVSLAPVSGPVAGGTVVSVSGSGFVSGATSATVDGVSVVAAVASGSVLSFVSPAHAVGAVAVLVTTPGGTSQPLTFRYRPVPTAVSLSPVSGPVAGGTAVTVTGTGFVGGGTW